MARIVRDPLCGGRLVLASQATQVIPSGSQVAWAPDVKMVFLNTIQWPAMLVTVVAAWMVASQRKYKRNWGFWLFLLSNVLWIIWGLHDRAYALIMLQLGLAVMNIRGAVKNSSEET